MKSVLKSGSIICCHSKKLLVAFAFLTLVFSCRKTAPILPADTTKKDLDIKMSTADGLVFTSSKLIHEEIFEGLGPYFYLGSIQKSTSYGFTRVSSPVYQGSKVGRFELRDTDPEASGGTRAEGKFPPLTNRNRWYSFSVNFPSTDYKYDSKPEIINQWHQGGGTNPSISLITRYDKMYLEIRPVPSTYYTFELGSIVKDKWQTYVFHIYHSNTSSGITELWRDGVKIFSRNGANSYDFALYDKPTWKFGLYKWEWNGTKVTDTKKRVIFFDNVRVGNENATYADMVLPATSLLAPLVYLKSFTLVNAATEKDITTISDGATITLSQLSSSKLNIRANPGLPMGSVKFVLSGPQVRTVKDSQLPYSLNGDDGNGNYYFSSWDPPPVGTYTMEAIPYTGTATSGLLGIKSKISFQVVK